MQWGISSPGPLSSPVASISRALCLALPIPIRIPIPNPPPPIGHPARSPRLRSTSPPSALLLPAWKRAPSCVLLPPAHAPCCCRRALNRRPSPPAPALRLTRRQPLSTPPL